MVWVTRIQTISNTRSELWVPPTQDIVSVSTVATAVVQEGTAMTESRDVKFNKPCQACNGTGFEPDNPAVAKTIAEMYAKHGHDAERVRETIHTYLTHASEYKTVWTTEDPEPPRTVRLRDREGDVWWYSLYLSRWVCSKSADDGYHWSDLVNNHNNWFPMIKTNDYE